MATISEATSPCLPIASQAAEAEAATPPRHEDPRRLRGDSEAIRHAFESGEFPYKSRLSERVYLEHMAALQVELVESKRRAIEDQIIGASTVLHDFSSCSRLTLMTATPSVRLSSTSVEAR